MLLLYSNVLRGRPRRRSWPRNGVIGCGDQPDTNGAEFSERGGVSGELGHRLTAFLQYACMLQRDSEQWERNYWANLMSTTETVAQVFLDFVNSAEMAIHLQ